MWAIIREFVGWMITLTGLALVGVLLVLALNRNVFEAMALSIPATVVFRSGIGLVRLNAAGRIAKSINRD